MHLNHQLVEKTRESMASVLPITAIVLLLSITVAPLDSAVLVLFLFGAVLLVGGMGLFTMGVDMSMIPMGEVVGVTMSRSKFFLLPVAGYFLLGVLSTVAEPDLQVLAEQVPPLTTWCSSSPWRWAWAFSWWWPPCASAWLSPCGGCCWCSIASCFCWPPWP